MSSPAPGDQPPAPDGPETDWPPPGTTPAPYPPLPARGLTVDQCTPLTTKHVD